MNEQHIEYRSIPNFPRYEAGSDGSIRVAGRKKTMKCRITPRGYARICLRKSGATFHQFVHRLVLFAFVGSPKNGEFCAHANGVRTDNRISNLRWDTLKNNNADKKIHGTWQAGEMSSNHKLSIQEVESMRVEHDNGESKMSLAKKYGISRRHVSSVVRGEYWKSSPAELEQINALIPKGTP